MDRPTRLFLAHDILERARGYTKETFNDLFRAMDDIERGHGLTPKLTNEEEAAVTAAEKWLARGEKLPEHHSRGQDADAYR